MDKRCVGLVGSEECLHLPVVSDGGVFGMVIKRG